MASLLQREHSPVSITSQVFILVSIIYTILYIHVIYKYYTYTNGINSSRENVPY